MARRSLFINAGWVVALVLVSETIAQSQNNSTKYLPSSAGSDLTEGDSWLRTGLNTVLQYAGGRFFPMRTSAGVRFMLYTRRGKEQMEMSQSSIEASGFDSSNPTTVLVHGYYNKVVGQSSWLGQVAEALLEKGPWNVIVVDWSRLCTVFYASTVVRARRIPGPVTADLLRMLQYVKGLDLSTVHVVGFSLGAHVAGFIGQNIQGIGRITGLDPAGPQFRTAMPSRRLSSDDALFVDVVNTNVESFITGLSLGINPDVDVGHVSVALNGGVHQPGCWVGTSCSHYPAPTYFIESVQLAEDFLVYPCETSNKTLPVPFGLHMPHTARGCYFATVNRNEPYLQKLSPLSLQHPTTESSDVFEDDASLNNRRVDDQSSPLEQDYPGQESLLDYPDSTTFVEQEQDQKPELVVESEQLLNPEQVLENEQLVEPDYVLEPEKLMNLKHFFQPEQLMELNEILQPKQFSEHGKVLEPDQLSETKLFIEPKQIFNLNKFPNLRTILQSVVYVTQNPVWESDHPIESFKTLKPQQHNKTQVLVHSSIIMPSKVEAQPVQSVPSQTPVNFHGQLHPMRPAESQSFVPIVKPTESSNLHTFLHLLPKPVHMPNILRPQKPLEPSESVTRKPITMFDILMPWSKRLPLMSQEDYEAKLEYESVLAEL